MVPKCVLFFVFASLLALSNGQSSVSDPPPQPLTPEKPTSTEIPKTTTLPPTSTSTTKPTTPPANTTTTAPSTTTHAPTPAPNTTTTAPPTTPPTTTPTPANTTSAPTTTTPVPIITTTTPAPGPALGNWTVKDGNVTCIIIAMAIQLNITYEGIDNKTRIALIDVPPNKTLAAGHCGNDSQLISLTWSNKDNSSNVLVLTFGKNNKTEKFMITNITVDVSAFEFPSKKDNTTVNLFNNKTQFPTSLEKSYHCAKEQTISLDVVNTNKTVGYLDVSKVHLQAFHENSDNSFGAAEDCESGGSSPDVVPIAVGCALVGLVAVVLIAYLVGRRRSQARGYLSIVRSDSDSDIPLQETSRWKKCW